MDLVTLDEARAQLQVDTDASGGSPHDVWLSLAIAGVSGAVAAWLKDEWRLYVPLLDSNDEVIRDSNGDPVPSDAVQPAVKLATLVEIAQQFRYREGTDAAQVPAHWGHGYTLGVGATALLTPFRKGTVA